MEEPAEILQGVRDALEEMDFAFEEAAKAVSAERLHDANVDVGIKMLKEGGAVRKAARSSGRKLERRSR